MNIPYRNQPPDCPVCDKKMNYHIHWVCENCSSWIRSDYDLGHDDDSREINNYCFYIDGYCFYANDGCTEITRTDENLCDIDELSVIWVPRFIEIQLTKQSVYREFNKLLNLRNFQ